MSPAMGSKLGMGSPPLALWLGLAWRGIIQHFNNQLKHTTLKT